MISSALWLSALICAPARSATPALLSSLPDSDWLAVGTVGDSVSEGNPSAREKVDFWDKLRDQSYWDDGINKFCKAAQIPVSYRAKLGEFATIRPEVKRFLKTGYDGRLLLVDVARLDLNLGYSRPLAALADSANVGVWIGAGLEGLAMVTRPLEGKKACPELDEFFDLREYKTLPFNAERFAAMQDGEIWNIPLRLHAGFAIGAGGSAVANMPLSVSFGYSREGGAAVSLRRLDRSTLRLRLRLDHMQVWGPSVGLVYSLFGSEWESLRAGSREALEKALGELAGKLADKGIDRLLAGAVSRYLTASISGMAQWSSDDHAVIEFLLDPDDPRQMQGLEQLLAGGDLAVLDTLGKMAKLGGKSLLHSDAMHQKVEGLQRQYGETLAASKDAARSFAGTQRARGFLLPLRVKIPLLADLAWASGRRDEQTHLFDGVGGQFWAYRSHEESNAGFLDIPLLGRLVTNNERKSAAVYTYADADGKAAAPALVFVHQSGYTNVVEGAARALALSSSRIMSLAGTRGRGENPRAALPLDTVFPRQPRAAQPPSPSPRRRDEPFHDQPDSPSFRRGMAAFTMALGEKALDEIVRAPAEDVLRAYVRMAAPADRHILDKVLEQGNILPDGTVKYEHWKLFGGGYGDKEKKAQRESVYDSLDRAKKLTGRLRAIAAIRREDSTDPEASRRQSEALRDLLRACAQYGLAFEEMVGVLVQLADPSHISAEFIVAASPSDKRNGKRVEGRYLYRRGLEEDPSVRRLAETSARFDRPNEQTD